MLAVDLGTGGPKAAVVSAGGKILGHGFEGVGLTLVSGGGAEQDPEEWWAAVVSACRKAISASGVAPEQVVGIGCTAQWSGTVAVGADGRAIGNAISWMDSRGSGPVRQRVRGPVNVLGYAPDKAVRWIRRSGGVPSQSGKDPVGHILFLKETRPEVYRAASVFLEPVDYLNLRLTGLARASFDSITVHWVTDNRRIDQVAYDPSLLALAGLDVDTLPPLLPTATVVGGLRDDAAGELGVLPGTAVVTGTGDLHSAAVGSGAVGDFDGHLYIGTSSWISCHVPFKKTSAIDNIASIPAGLPGRYLVADEHETGGACLTWLRDQLLFTDGVPKDALDQMNRLAASAPPGSNGVLFTPWLNGERSPVDDHTIRAGFHNLSLSSTRADMVRAVFEGVALNSRWLADAVEKFVGRPFESLAFVGGGANSDLWCQIHADVMDRPIRQIGDPVLANVRGAALLALVALSRIRPTDIPAMVEVRRTYRPDRERAALYRPVVTEFVNLYKATKGIHRRLNRHCLGAGPPGNPGNPG